MGECKPLLRGGEPVLLVTPGARDGAGDGTRLEAWRTCHEDPLRRQSEFEGVQEWVAHSAGWAAQRWGRAGAGEPWLVPTQRRLAPGAVAVFRLHLSIVPAGVRGAEPAMCAAGRG